MAERFDTELMQGSCPYCGEPVSLVIDPGGLEATAQQQYIEDCEVCCRPMQVSIEFDGQGACSLRLASEQDC